VCLKTLRARNARREVPLDWHVPDPIVTGEERGGPEQAALLVGDVGLALLAVLDALAPAERLAFVLHDMFAVPFDEVAVILTRTPAAARQLASRARRRVRRAAPVPDPDPANQREVADAFFAASRAGEIDALIAVLASDVVVRSDGGLTRPGLSAVIRGAEDAGGEALGFARLSPFTLCSSTVPQELWQPRMDGRTRLWPSPSRTGRSPPHPRRPRPPPPPRPPTEPRRPVSWYQIRRGGLPRTEWTLPTFGYEPAIAVMFLGHDLKDVTLTLPVTLPGPVPPGRPCRSRRAGGGGRPVPGWAGRAAGRRRAGG
jgi:hypothetical protein